ncbi:MULTISPECIES: hypothetical protein [Paenibacillus]|uniref:Uncharacterized protein n=1 Tax=Paenibacillus naphthalenovorans TaxID=162209 RepID=A0A0U2W5X6_9BACL|nr:MULTISPECIES: hypothetical protein [Paenibacillus]ALS20826.1 hypothetical protein IJ22_04380 [Paenibacillus naphthalenovorans]GCL70856.1 hypothetical protein PN4B1_07590 [Paenibacillus naphthalenovorans]SDI20871.1 hypothetical protein SAMN05421868_10472 [Paenibacillus naphthalenovorans]
MLQVYDDVRGDVRYLAGELAALCPESFLARNRVKGVNGKTIDWSTRYTA